MLKNSINAVIIDDETPAREELTHLLSKFSYINIIGTAKDGVSGKELIMEKRVDIAFLDIEMPGLSGIELSKILKSIGRAPIIIFTTAYSNFAVEAFEVEAVDYLLKPLREEKLERAVIKAKKQLDQNNVNILSGILANQSVETKCKFLSVYSGDHIIPIKIQHIDLAEARGRFTWITTKNGEFKTTLSFKEVEETLSSSSFFTCHRSFIVNLESIESVELWVNNSYRLKIRNSRELIPVSRSRKEELQSILSI